MTRLSKNWYLGFIFLMLSTFLPVSRLEAFSLINPFSLFSEIADTASQRMSDIFYYLVMQKKYIFDHFTDPNVYIPVPAENKVAETLNVPKELKEEPPAPKPNSGKPIPVESPELPNIVPAKPVPPKSAGQVATSAPGLVIDIPTSSLSVKLPVSEKKVVASSSVDNLVYDNSLILVYTNKERLADSLPPLSSNKTLDRIAEARVTDLFKKQYFEHESPDGQSADDLAKDYGYDYLLIGENLAMGNFEGDQGIVSAWMDSTGHRENILNRQYQELGVAKQVGNFDGREVTIAVQIFGKPAALCNKPNPQTKALIESSSVSISQMEAQAKAIFDNLNSIKDDPQVDKSYYYQKVQEYNYFAKNINSAVADLKDMVELYNSQVNEYNICINL